MCLLPLNTISITTCTTTGEVCLLPIVTTGITVTTTPITTIIIDSITADSLNIFQRYIKSLQLKFTLLSLMMLTLQRNTFQAIVITDSTETYTVFSYGCDLLEWTGHWRHAAVGYSIRIADISELTDFDHFANHPLSLRSSIGSIACQNTANNIPWSNLVYKIGESKTTVQQLRAQCKKVYQKDIRQFPNIGVVQDALLPCPCSVRQIWWDRRYRYFKYSYAERRACYTQRFPSRHRASQLCCYSYE